MTPDTLYVRRVREPLAEPDGRLAEILIDDWINNTAPRLTFRPHRKCPCADCTAAFADTDGPA